MRSTIRTLRLIAALATTASLLLAAGPGAARRSESAMAAPGRGQADSTYWTVDEIQTAYGAPGWMLARARRIRGIAAGEWEFSSADGGRTWAPLASRPWTEHGFAGTVALAARPGGNGTPRLLVSAVRPEQHQDALLYRSGDGGQTWGSTDLFTTTLDAWNSSHVQFTSSPAAPLRLYAAAVLTYHYLADGVMRYKNVSALYTSADGGATWTAIRSHPEWRHSQRYQVLPMIDHPAGLLLYDGHSDTNAQIDEWLFSADAGQTWQPATQPISRGTVLLDQRDPQLWYNALDWQFGIGTRGLRSRDGGATWAAWATQPCPSFALRASPQRSGMLFAQCAQDGALYRSSDAGDTWRPLNQAGRLSVDRGHANRLLLLRDNALWESLDDGDTWALVNAAIVRPDFALAPQGWLALIAGN